nr:MAG TPA: hypothetical protein [Caudoviricetes sp.]
MSFSFIYKVLYKFLGCLEIYRYIIYYVYISIYLSAYI